MLGLIVQNRRRFCGLQFHSTVTQGSTGTVESQPGIGSPALNSAQTRGGESSAVNQVQAALDIGRLLKSRRNPEPRHSQKGGDAERISSIYRSVPLRRP
jgi:hypothetical protein